MSEVLTQLLRDIELGPVNSKIAAIGSLRALPGVQLDLVRPVLDKVIVQAPSDSLLRFCAAANLLALGDDRDDIVEILIPYLAMGLFEVDDNTYYFPWLKGLEKNFHREVNLGNVLSFSAHLATLEALSHSRTSNRAAQIMIDLLGVQDKPSWRIFTIYAVGANGNPIGQSTLEYYKDKFAKNLEGRAAQVALEHFGTATLLDIARFHR